MPKTTLHNVVPLLGLVFCAYFAPHGAWAAPAPAAVVKTAAPKIIDADPADWANLKAEQAIAGQGGGAATFKLAYDADSLYALVRVSDDSPLRNGAARPEEMLKGGDAVGFYFGPAGGKGTNQRIMVAPIDGRPQIYVYRPTSDVKKPYAFSSPVSTLTFDYVAPLPEAQAALKAAPGGYVAEVRIPWRALGYGPSAGLRLPFDLQIIYSDPAGTVNVATRWWNTTGSDAFTVEDLPTEAKLYPDGWGTAALFSEDPSPAAAAGDKAAVAGVPITFALPRPARVSLVITDGSGWIVRELLRAEKRSAGKHTVEWDGRDRYGEPLPPGPYRWKLAYFDGMGSTFYGSVGNSGRPPYRTPDGKGSIGGQHGLPSAVGADAGGIYMLNAGEEGHPAMRKIGPTGEALWKRSMGGFGRGIAVASDERYTYVLNYVHRQGIDLLRLDPQTGRDAAAFPGGAARLRLVDYQNLPDDPKKTKPENDAARRAANQNAEPQGLAVAGNKAYYSLPGENRIGVVDLATGVREKGIALSAPSGLCRWGADRLLACSGRTVVTINLATRQVSPLLEGLSRPHAVAVDAAGNLYVSDLGTSQQIKKFSRDGKLRAAWGTPGGRPRTVPRYNPLQFDNVIGLAIGPDGNLWMVESSAPLKRFARMTTGGKWLEDFYGPVAYNTFGPDLDDVSTIYYQRDSTQHVRTELDYPAYAADPKNPARGWRVEAIYDLAEAPGGARNEIMAGPAGAGYGHSIAFTGKSGKRYFWRLAKHNRYQMPPGAALWVWENGRWVPAAFVTNDQSRQKSWADANGDGQVQDTELYPGPPTSNFAWIDRDLNLYGFDGTLSAAKIDGRGVPDYRGGKFTPYLRPGEPPLKVSYPSSIMGSMPGADGAQYFAANIGPHRHLTNWDRASENRVIKVKDGRAQWVIGRHDAHGEKDGDLTTVSGVAGVVDDIVIVHTVEPAQYIAYTSDGFLLGNVLVDETGSRPKVGPNAIYIESLTGLFIKDPKTGKRLLLAVSSGDDRILEVTGPGPITRQEGSLVLDTSRPHEQETPGKAAIPYETWYGNVAAYQGIDGFDYEWQPAPKGIPIRDGKTVVADVRLRRDAGNLYLLVSVLDPTPFQNGDGVELLLGPGEPARTRPGAGDTRIVLKAARKEDKSGGIAWAYRPASETATQALTPLPGAQVAVVERWRGYGYRLEAEIPLAFVPEIARKTRQTFRRGGGKGELASFTEERYDLTGPIRFNVALFLDDGKGGVKRLPWVADGQGAGDPAGMNPSRWGVVDAAPD